jgi:hypothetical protein
MDPLTVSSIVLAFVFGGALFGMFLQTVVPTDHLSPRSTDLVKLGMGLIVTMTAMVLGLVLASAKGSYDTQKGELTALSANIVLLDRVLAHYGPETKESRDILRGAVTHTLDRLWPEDRSRDARLEAVPGAEVLYDKIEELAPKSDEQRSAKSQALNILINVGETHWLMLEQQASSVPLQFITVVVSWLTVIFISFGLLAPRNATVVATLFICALSVSTAIFLILELYTPYSGLIRISSDPLHNALVHLGR